MEPTYLFTCLFIIVVKVYEMPTLVASPAGCMMGMRCVLGGPHIPADKPKQARSIVAADTEPAALQGDLTQNCRSGRRKQRDTGQSHG